MKLASFFHNSPHIPNLWISFPWTFFVRKIWFDLFNLLIKTLFVFTVVTLIIYISFPLYIFFKIYWGHYRGLLLAGIWFWQLTSNLRGPCSRIFFIIQTSLLSSSASEEFRVFSFTRIWISFWDSQLFGSSALVPRCIRGPSCPFWIKNGKSGFEDF